MKSGSARYLCTFAQILRSSESHLTFTAAKILGCLNSVSLKRKAWLPSTGTVTSILRRERSSSIDFVPSLCCTPRPSIVPQNESQPSAIPLTVPFHSSNGTFRIKININLTLGVCKRRELRKQERNLEEKQYFVSRENKNSLPSR